jgi:hypothetical protein
MIWALQVVNQLQQLDLQQRPWLQQMLEQLTLAQQQLLLLLLLLWV